MKKLLILTVILVLFLFSCKKHKAVSHNNCDNIVTDTVAGENVKIYMPNAFTPNADGLNDMIRPFFQHIASFNFTIYDGNNGLVFNTNTVGMGWTAPVGANSFETYYYRIECVTDAGHYVGTCGELYKLSCRPANALTLYFEDQLTQDGFTGTTHELLPACP